MTYKEITHLVGSLNETKDIEEAIFPYTYLIKKQVLINGLTPCPR